MKFSIVSSDKPARAAAGLLPNGGRPMGLFALVVASIPTAQASCGHAAGLVRKRLQVVPASVLAALVLAGILSSPAPMQAADESEESLVTRGFQIAPVPLNMAGKNWELVGLGSYLVNAGADCNGCHTSGGPPNFNYAAGSNPYFNQPKKVDPATYLGGGRDFGPVGPPANPGPDIIARNLTPDKTGKAEGGHSLSDFLTIMTTGKDFDHLHPTCSSAVTSNCIPPPVDGDLLQVMPWPVFQNMSHHQLHAIYEYLSAIPCIAGPPAPSPLHNDCQ